MNRRLACATAVVVVAAVGVAPAHAVGKKKPKPIKGSYSVRLVPDPLPDTPAQTGCDYQNPLGVDRHAFKVPAKGTLKVTLTSMEDPATSIPYTFDWDLYITDASGELDSSHSALASEETTTKFKKKQTVSIDVCNLTGAPDATVSYVFTYA